MSGAAVIAKKKRERLSACVLLPKSETSIRRTKKHAVHMLSPGVTAATKKATREMTMIKLPDKDDLSGGSMDRLDMRECLSGKSKHHGVVFYCSVYKVTHIGSLPITTESSLARNSPNILT
jgi:hypothetical protein